MERGTAGSGESLKADVETRAALCEREKRELRLERDRLVLDLARSLGTDELARSFGTSGSTAELLVQRASERLAAERPEISARRVERDRRDRWREADRHYAALGRAVPLPRRP